MLIALHHFIQVEFPCVMYALLNYSSSSSCMMVSKQETGALVIRSTFKTLGLFRIKPPVIENVSRLDAVLYNYAALIFFFF